MNLTFCHFRLQIRSFKRRRAEEPEKAEVHKYAVFVSFLPIYAEYIHFLSGEKKIVHSQTKNFSPHINSKSTACRGKNPPEMGILRRAKRRKTAFLRFFRSIFLLSADKNPLSECSRFRPAGFCRRGKKRTEGGSRLLLSRGKAVRLSF